MEGLEAAPEHAAPEPAPALVTADPEPEPEPKPKRQATPAQLRNLEKAREAKAKLRYEDHPIDPATLPPPTKAVRRTRRPSHSQTLLSVQRNTHGLTIF